MIRALRADAAGPKTLLGLPRGLPRRHHVSPVQREDPAALPRESDDKRPR